MDILDRAQSLARAGKQREAIALLRGAAAGGDLQAVFAVANWMLFGINGPRDAAGARRLLETAAQQGSGEARRLCAYLIANGTGGEADWKRAQAMLAECAAEDPVATRQLDLLATMPFAEDGPNAETPDREMRVMSDDPAIRLIPDFLSIDEIGHLKEVAAPHLRPSAIVHPVTRARSPHPSRRSEDMSIGPTQEDLVVNAINRRIARASGTMLATGEPLQILRYTPGQHYLPHMDAVPGTANQREWTMLVYLNDDYEGGETHFLDLDLTVRGEPGDALLFRNVDAAGAPDPRTRHAGREVRSGVKWLASRWIRARAFDPWSAQA